MDFPFRQQLWLGVNAGRSLSYILQNLSLPYLERWIAKTSTLPKHEAEKLKVVIRELQILLKKDAALYGEHIEIKTSLNKLLNSFSAIRFLDLIYDGYRVAKRREQNQTHEFEKENKMYMEQTPAYFHRNFHFQTDGYLSTQSAERYDHQVEVLFAGGADAMRRLLIEPLLNRAQRPQKILELGTGTGSFTYWLKYFLPEAEVTCVDLSHPYLWKARQRLDRFVALNFLQADAAQLPLPDQSFDAVVSCFLFHELPLTERNRVLREALRVLKPGGFIGHVDSLQMNDNPDLNWALLEFPKRFHEPFYKNYIETPLEDLHEQAGFAPPLTETGYFAKALWSSKPEI